MTYTFRIEAMSEPLFFDTALAATSGTSTNGMAGILVAAKSAGTAMSGRAKTPSLSSYGPTVKMAISAMDKVSARRTPLSSRCGCPSKAMWKPSPLFGSFLQPAHMLEIERRRHCSQISPWALAESVPNGRFYR